MDLYQVIILSYSTAGIVVSGIFFLYQHRFKAGHKKNERVPAMGARQNLKLMEHIVDNIWHGVMVIDQNREIVSINESLSSLFYLSKEDAVGRKTINIFNNNRFEEFISRALESLEPQRENLIFYEDEELYMDMEVFPVTSRGDLIGKDKKAGPGIKLVILAKNNTQEVEFSKLRSQFVANVSHEMRTPLTSIRGYLEILEDELKENKDAKQYILKSLKETIRLNDLIEDVLNLSKIEYKRNVLLKEEVEIVGTIKEVLAGLKYLAIQNGVAVDFNYSQESVYFVTDPDLFRQLVKNLAENAIFHGGRQCRLSISLGSTKEGIYIYFKDDGVGISKQDLSYIFQRFYRGSNPFSAKRIGSGLGLSIVKHIVDLHNGRIKVISKPNVETVFKVFLPGKPGAGN